MPEPPQLIPFDADEQWLYFKLLNLSLTVEPSHPLEETMSAAGHVLKKPIEPYHLQKEDVNLMFPNQMLSSP